MRRRYADQMPRCPRKGRLSRSPVRHGKKYRDREPSDAAIGATSRAAKPPWRPIPNGPTHAAAWPSRFDSFWMFFCPEGPRPPLSNVRLGCRSASRQPPIARRRFRPFYSERKPTTRRGVRIARRCAPACDTAFRLFCPNSPAATCRPRQSSESNMPEAAETDRNTGRVEVRDHRACRLVPGPAPAGPRASTRGIARFPETDRPASTPIRPPKADGPTARRPRCRHARRQQPFAANDRAVSTKCLPAVRRPASAADGTTPKPTRRTPV